MEEDHTKLNANGRMSLMGVTVALAASLLVATAVGQGAGTTTPGTVGFTITPLIRPDGSSEPELAIGADGSVVYAALSWTKFQTNVWTGHFGSTPVFQGAPDARIDGFVGGEDADVDLGSTGTLHISTLMALFNPVGRFIQLGVSAITCPNADTSKNFANCKAQIVATTNSDRQWITSDGPHVYISVHDPFQASLIHVLRSNDDGFTWQRVGDPIVGQGGVTADSTFNNDQGKITADPTTHNVYTIFASGVAGLQKATTANFNQIFVSRSADLGVTWTPNLVFSGVVNVAENNIFPVLAADPTTGTLYASWSDAHHVFFSVSKDQATTWSPAVAVNIAPANTALFPWLSALNGKVDLVYYGTDASSKDDPSAVWHVYIAQTSDGGAHFAQSRVNEETNHVGVICTQGTACKPGTRNLLDLFQVAIDPQSGRAAIIYTDDTLTTTSSGSKLPQVVLAQET